MGQPRPGGTARPVGHGPGADARPCGRRPTSPMRSTEPCCRRSSRSRWSARIPARSGQHRPDQGWLKDVLKLRRSPGAGEITAHNNHHLLRASVDMAWGALTNDTTNFQHGIAAYVEALAADAAPTAACRSRRRAARGRSGTSGMPWPRWWSSPRSRRCRASISSACRSTARPASRDRLPAGRDRAAGAGLALRRRQRQSGRRAQLPGPGPGLPGAPRPWPALHGLGRDLYRALPRSGGEPPAAGAAQGSRSRLPPDGRRVQRRQHHLLFRAAV